jgi:hypothetical protein
MDSYAFLRAYALTAAIFYQFVPLIHATGPKGKVSGQLSGVATA